MGNFMETCIDRQQIAAEEKQEEIEAESESGFVKEINRLGKGSSNSMRVKIVLTKEELEWFMLQLKDNNNKGGRSLEDVLGEIERNRAKLVEVWTPSLESIMECPEVADHMDRS